MEVAVLELVLELAQGLVEELAQVWAQGLVRGLVLELAQGLVEEWG